MNDDMGCQAEAQSEDTARAGVEGVQETDSTTTREEHIQETGREADGADEVKALPVRRHGMCSLRHRTWETAGSCTR